MVRAGRHALPPAAGAVQHRAADPETGGQRRLSGHHTGQAGDVPEAAEAAGGGEGGGVRGGGPGQAGPAQRELPHPGGGGHRYGRQVGGAELAARPGVEEVSWRERNVLFNDALNTFYLRLYGVGKKISCFICKIKIC